MINNQYIEALEGNRREPFLSIAREYLVDFEIKTYIRDGIVRWENSNKIPSLELLQLWHYAGKEFDFDKTLEIYQVEKNLLLEESFKQLKTRIPTDEELFELYISGT